MSSYSPGGDAKVIAEIAQKKFGGFAAMFKHHDWPERGSDMMRKVADTRSRNLWKREGVRGVFPE